MEERNISQNINKKNTLYSNNIKKASFSSLVNHSNKQKLIYRAYSKKYGNVIPTNSPIDSTFDRKRFAKTPKNLFKFKDKKFLMKRAKTIQTMKKSESKITADSLERSDNLMMQKLDLDLINI